MDSAKKQARGTIIALVGGCLWGLSGSCGQFLFENKGVTSQWLVPIRLLVAGLLLVLFLWAKNGKAVFAPWRNKKDALQLLIFGIFGMMLCQYSYFTAIQHSNAGTATVLQYLYPAMILCFVCLRKRIRPMKIEVAAMFLALLGTFLLATHGNLSSLAISPAALFWGGASAVFAAIYTLYPESLLEKYGAALINGWGMLIGGLVLSLFVRPWSIPVQVDAQVVLVFAVIVLFGTIAAFTLYLGGVKIVGPTKGSLYASIEPVSATVISVLWLQVAFSWIDLVGFICILSTIFLLAFAKSSGGKRTPSGKLAP